MAATKASPRPKAAGPKGGRGLRRLSEADRRVYESIPADIEYVPHPDFRLAATEERLFGPDAEEIAVHRWRQFPQVGEAEAPVRPRRKLSREQEAELFLRYNYARYRVARAVRPQARRFSLARAREAVAWYRRVLKTRAAIVGANMPLVVAMAKRMRIDTVDFAELVSEGNMALMRSVDKFDVARGFKFSTYACRAILKAFNRLVSKTGRYRQQFPAEYDPAMERSDELERRHADERELAVEDLRRVFAYNAAGLSGVERTVVGARFAVDGFETPQTLEQVGSLVGLSKERVRQVQSIALEKLKGALEDVAA